MKRIVYLVFVALALFAGCTKENGQYNQEEAIHHFRINTTAPSLETEAPGTRAEMKASVRLQWTDGDQISVVNLSTGKTMLGNLTARVTDDKVRFEGELSGSIKAGNKMAAIYPSQNYTGIINIPDFDLDLSSQQCTTKEDLRFVAYSLFDCQTTGVVDVTSDFVVPVSFNQIALATLDPETQIDYVELTNVGNGITFHANKDAGTLELTPSVGKVRITPESKSSGKNGALFAYCALASSPASARTITVKALPKIYVTSWAESAMAAAKFYTSVASGFEAQEYKNFMVSAPSSLEVGYQGGTVVFSVTSNDVSWTASSTPALTIAPASGNGCENLEVTVTVPQNNGTAGRSFVVTLSGGSDEYQYTITQKADPEKEVVEIPDINLKKYLLPIFDEDEDGQITVVEAENIQIVNCSGRNVADLSGLEKCPNLKYLNLNGNYVSEIILPNLAKLETIVAYGNPVEKLVVNNDIALTTLNLQSVSTNALSGQSITIDQYTQAETLYLAFAGTEYTTLNITNSSVLSSIDISENVQLTKLNASGNSLIQDINLETLVNLTDVDVKNCNLSALNVDSNVNLVNLDCSNNKISSLNVENNVALVSLICAKNQLSSLRVINNVCLEKIDVMTNSLSILNVRKNTALKELNVANNSEISALALVYNTELEALYAYNTGLTDIDLSTNTKLQILNLDGCSELHVIDLTNNTALMNLVLVSTSISVLDLSKNTELHYLDISNTAISALNLSTNTKLDTLNLKSTAISSINLKKNKELLKLDYTEGIEISSGFSVGHYIVVNGVAGVTFYVSGTTTKIISLDESFQVWSTDTRLFQTNTTDGFDNTQKILNYSPAAKWCVAHGNRWYLPALDEFKPISKVYTTLNTTLSSRGGTKLTVDAPGTEDLYWSSSEIPTYKDYPTYGYPWAYAYYISSQSTAGNTTRKSTFRVRAIRQL